jgi:16S rRNA processing protein RimM
MRLQSFSGDYRSFTALKTLRLRLPSQSEIDKKVYEKTYHIEHFDEGRKLVRLKGIKTPEEARALTGCEVVISREEAAAPEAGEYFIEDLKGLLVYIPAGVCCGSVNDIVEGGGGFLVEVKLENGFAFVPFRNEFFGEVDIAGGKIELLAPWALE